jgi:peptidoglycan/LPS O-acetylase OafA/YrhL
MYLLHPLIVLQVISHLHHGTGPRTLGFDLVVGSLVLIPATALGYAVMERPFIARRRAWNQFAGSAEPAADPAPAGNLVSAAG